MLGFFHALLQPHVLLYGVLVFALVRLWRRPDVPRRALVWVTVPFVVLSLLCMPALAYVALGSLEWPYPSLRRLPGDAQAIVVLSGYVRPADGDHAEAELGEGTLYRCLKAFELYRQRPTLPLVVSGGVPSPTEPGPANADVMRDFLVKLGADPGLVIPEAKSRNTYENAVETAKLLRERGLTKVVLVTDAAHLRRGVGCFAAQGIEVIPCGCRYRAADFDASLLDFVPNATAAGNLRAAAHEWLGIGWYWARGRL